jgi:putative redox protein
MADALANSLPQFCYIKVYGCIETVSTIKGKAFMQTASVKWIGEQQFVGISPSGHAVPFDSDRESNKAPGPMEMVLMALGACTATDVVIILAKKRQKLATLEVLCSGERATESPTVWTKLEVLFRIRGEVEEAAMKHAMDLTEEKYCSVAAMLKKTAAFTWRYELLPAVGR